MKLDLSSLALFFLVGGCSAKPQADVSVMGTGGDATTQILQAAGNFRVKAHNRILQSKFAQETRRRAASFEPPSDITPHIDQLSRRSRRRLDDQCVPSVIYEDDDDYLVAFGDNYQPTCECVNEEPDFNTTAAEAEQAILDNNITDLATATQVALETTATYLNTLLKQVTFVEEAMCYNDCASCVDGYCGYIETVEKTSFTMTLTRDMTADDVRTLISATEQEEDQFFEGIFRFSQLDYLTQDCFNFVSGPHGTGKGCLLFGFDYNPNPPATLTELENIDVETIGSAKIEISVDGTNCKSCSFEAGEECLECDCTNLYANAMPKTCDGNLTYAGTWDYGLLAPMHDLYIGDNELTAHNYTLGECGNRPVPDDDDDDDDDSTSAAAGMWSHFVFQAWVVPVSLLAFFA